MTVRQVLGDRSFFYIYCTDESMAKAYGNYFIPAGSLVIGNSW